MTIKSSGTRRWVSQKVSAKHVLSKLSVYISRPVNRAKPKGNLTKWVDAKAGLLVLCSPNQCRKMIWTFLQYLPPY